VKRRKYQPTMKSTQRKKCICVACGGDGFDRVSVEMKMETEELTNKLDWQFLYFSDPAKPAGQKFLGAVIVEAHGFLTAIRRAHQLGINPGGAVYHFDAPAHDPSMRNRLIIDDETMEKLGYKRRAA